MKFTAPPRHTVRIQTPYIQRALGRKYLFFDENGVIDTEKPSLIKILTLLAERDGSVISIESESSIETKPESAENTEVIRHCKKCNFTCTNQGDLMRHYRECHPKGE